jgi:hypothetical protein
VDLVFASGGACAAGDLGSSRASAPRGLRERRQFKIKSPGVDLVREGVDTVEVDGGVVVS